MLQEDRHREGKLEVGRWADRLLVDMFVVPLVGMLQEDMHLVDRYLVDRLLVDKPQEDRLEGQQEGMLQVGMLVVDRVREAQLEV